MSVLDASVPRTVVVRSLALAALGAPLPASALPAAALQGPTPDGTPGLEQAAAPRTFAPAAPKTDPGPAPTFAQGSSIRDLMTEPLVSRSEGRVWVRTRDLRASFGEEGFTVFPVFGSASPREWPIEFDVEAITLGGQPLGTSVTAPAYERDGRVTLPRESAREVFHLGLDSIEQTFVFDALPGSGDLVVRMDVDTELDVLDSPEALRFSHDTFGEVHYGAAFVLDASGRREAIERTWDGEHLTLTVPAAFLAEAVLPVTIDPPVQGFINAFGADDDRLPDITYAARPGRYFFCWEEYTSSTNTDIYASMYAPDGTYVGAFAIDSSSRDCREPRMAYSAAGDRLLIVCTEPLVGSTGYIVARLFSATSQQQLGNPFALSFDAHDCYQPDVGGTSSDSANDNDFLVAWTRVHANGDRSVQYRLVEWTGTPTTSFITAAAATGERHFGPAVSESQGDPRLSGAEWTLVWTRDTGTDNLGQIWARRVRRNSSHTTGTGNFVVQVTTFNSHPTVTSLLDETLLNTSERPSIVAWQTRFSVPTGGYQRSIYARVITDGQVYGYNPISLTREGFDGDLDQFSPSIATDGDGFILTYSEGWWGNGDDHDMYMLSGHVSETEDDALIGLAERHVAMALTTAVESQGRVAMIQDGDYLATNDDGACIWVRDLPGFGGEIRGTTLDINTTDVIDEGSVGVQYCVSNPNSVGDAGGRTNSWLWIRGSQRHDRDHRAHCVDMPANSFGYLLCSMDSGFTANPAGSQGNLCLSGSIGRYSNHIASSGNEGEITTIIRPHSTPQPMGSIAIQAGQSWWYQLWHRDTVSGTATSNFSNVCRMTYTQ